MWTIRELKQNGYRDFKDNYWKCVVAGLLLFFTAPSVGGGVYGAMNVMVQQETSKGDSSIPALLGMLLLMIVVITIGIIVANIIKYFLLKPTEVGCRHFFSENTVTLGELGLVARAFDGGFYGNAVKTMFLKDLFTWFWSLLFVIPGIIKSYEYRMIPYILADEPQLTASEVFDLSKRMMQGNKMKAFLLDLSFVGWHILNLFTLGILGIFFVNPYVQSTYAELYQELKQIMDW